MATKTAARKTPARKTAARKPKVFSDIEREAMQETVRERKAASRRGSRDERAEGERDVRAKIAELPAPDRAMATRIHELVLSAAPSLVPRTFYGMPAYAKDGKVICFFQAKAKFKVRYSTFGFQPEAHLDDGEMWPTSFALLELTPRAEARITELVKKAVS
jgi:uncharacterized protein YdhG (YjbR/CyaY superfamily)